MSWKITVDHIAEPGETARVGATASKFGDTILGPGEPLPSEGIPERKFRLYDDDGELYYEGVLHDDDEGLNQLAALRFGEADAGCTTIRVEKHGVWTQEIG